jgi:hypothetical protein
MAIVLILTALSQTDGLLTDTERTAVSRAANAKPFAVPVLAAKQSSA